MRSLLLLCLLVALGMGAGCKCDGGSVASRYGDLVIVQLGTTGREVFSREATLTVPPTFMETVGTTEVPVRNVGVEEIVILSATRLEGDESLSMDGAINLAIAPEANAVLPVSFAPPQATVATTPEVTHRAKFSLKLSGAREGEDELLIELVAIAVARDCFVPAEIDFGRVPLQQAVISPLVLENGRALPSSTTVSAITGNDSSSFYFDGMSPIEVPAGGRVEVPVRFSPLEERSYEAAITIQRGTACPPAEVRLIGEGSNEALSWMPSSVAFGRIPLGVSVTRTVTVVNNTNVSLPLTAGVASTEFNLPGTPPTSLPPRSRTVIEVACAPQTLGPLSATLSLDIGTLPITPARIPLNCIGGGPRIRVDPAPLLFGTVPMDSVGREVTRRRLLVQNVGTAPPAPGDPANNLVLGRDGGLPWFSIVPKNLNTRIQEFSVGLRSNYDNSVGLPAVAGENFAEFEVSIAPTSPGVREADLLVYSNDQHDPIARVPITAAPRLPEGCALSISPEGADFGSAPRGAVLTRSIGLTNSVSAPSATCLVSGIEMAPGSNTAFVVSDPITGSLLIPRGETRFVRVSASVPGTANAGDYLRGQVRFSVSGESSPRLLPVDLNVSRCLVVDPPLLDLGLVQQNCTSGSKTVTLYNVCGVPITITGASTPAAPFRITSSPFGGGPVTLDPSNQLRVQVAAAPTTTGSFASTIVFDSEEAGVPYQQGVALRASADPLGIQQDAFTQGDSQVDILLVIDNSGSMGDEQAALAANFSSFMSSAASGNGNWHIGVTTTDVFVEKGVLVRSSGNPATLTPSTPNVASLFAQKVQVGTGGSGFEQAFAAASLAVNSLNRNGANAGFLRPSAVLAIVIVTDAIEQSPNSVGSYLAIFRAAKANKSELVQVSVVGPFSQPSTTCSTEGMVDPGRFETAINATGGVKSDICTLDWSSDLQNISRNLFGARRSFMLTGVARSAPDITVSINGSVIPSTAWQYDGTNNAVVFNSPPSPGSAIEISYRTACF